ncbi:MAG: bifunctional UDP-N-acetylglucosamine diphosphorylase/glucosamine-1-phosphate N-acetyltransferase GlmU [Vicinamibacterales bacterium]|jgi:bifunctional UDP-N-acetylglucosamine pyrophosphorylase/glucosamine-1-phosphate N-acetyltransferase|nr:bifunctional UDP-N-acetylglucosamine diphosphorylase/glucosamine-1-phosphate N-acetyltransferase GlmU [Acidobacteriota bacterium]MDP6081482.1 bifunctional UDP-N-acetylglucosamine diphosphorylase/glucosamine-1-phosphate N-acetyltransferase GlmU [Arenicellales bacterium]MDP7210419.1 bifunctional UDP-N-acetylglucosamine diphosphorylase/glucosamine-1-phosphate N-acetyltransferase GlmU [Vicinamibacterales bacterium]HJO16885.1 bifunctional UDP-N-acetylglucosamine diphosphorylase/glucosamine-1-phosp|tara:strand:+ start:1216 stop:2592 length:1377 start_codon:yes stop_codon:yes gene_type:complete
MVDTHVLILAAGMGTRMKSAFPKVLHRVAGRPMIEYALRAISTLNVASTTVVVGCGAEQVQTAVRGWPGVRFVIQEPQLGTGHALMQSESALSGSDGTLVLLAGDVPMVRSATLQDLVAFHRDTDAAATVLTATVPRPFGYGRIVRSRGQITRIVEERDATPAQRNIREINSGIYALKLKPLFDALRQIASENAQDEYYLTDLISIYRRRKLVVETVSIEKAGEVRGINSRTELAEVGAVVRQKKNEELMAAGVTIEDPATTYVDADVTVGADTVLHPGVTLEGRTAIGTACEIHSGVRIVDSTIENDVTINNHCVITGARVATGARVGPFAHLRPDADIRRKVKIGNFVEVKHAVVGPGSKANHLAYLGDATVGENVNIGAGTIICNYDGTAKHQTVIEDGAFIGSDTQLIAPVTVGKGAYVASGSSITDDVPPGSLAVARGRQTIKEGWVKRKRRS